MDLPDEILASLEGLETDGTNHKTASESSVYRFADAADKRAAFLKIQEPSWSPPLSLERDAMQWLSGKLDVPEVIAYHVEGSTEYLVTRELPGAASYECELDPERLIQLLADALQDIHAIPMKGCPFDKTPVALIDRGRDRIRAGIVTQKMVAEEGMDGSPDEALDELAVSMPAIEGPVINHGDYCLPNILIDQGSVSSFIDLGYVGIGDPYRDYTAAQYSVRRNLGDEWVQPFFDACGVEALDETRLKWYRQIQAFE